MAFWILDEWDGGTLDYATLGFIAEEGDVLEATAAPDPRWSSTGSGPETVQRYTVGSDPSYVEPGDGHVLTWSDVDNTYVPTARPVFVADDVDAAVATNLDDSASDTYAAIAAGFTMGAVVTHPQWGVVANSSAAAAANTAAFQAALDANLIVLVPGGVDIYIAGGLEIRPFQMIIGAGTYGQGSTTEAGGSSRLIFTGGGTAACISAATPSANVRHGGFANLTIMAAAGSAYSWMIDLPTCIGMKFSNLRLETTVLTTGGIRATKINPGDSSWVNPMHNVQIKLPEDAAATSTCLDVDWSDGEIVGGGCFGGQYGAILRGTGGIKLIGGRYSQTNASGAGIVLSVETESKSQHQILGCQIEEHKAIGLLIDGDADDTVVETWVMFTATGNQFRNPQAGAVDVKFKNDTGPVLRGGVLMGNIHTTTTSTPISYTPARWTDITIGPSGVTQGTGAPNAYAGGKFLQSPLVLAQSAVAVSHTGNLADTTLATISVPAGVMRANGRIRVTSQWSFTGAAGTKTPRVKFGGTAFSNPSIPSTQAGARLYTEIANRNATNSQVGMAANYGGWGNSTGAAVTAAIDTTVAQNLVLSAQLGDASESATLESYIVELIPGQ